MEEWLEIILKLLISLAASGLIGLEREVTGHKAGIRTQILVGVGSTSFIMLGVYSEMDVSEQGRILAGLATGLGFLGAGAIMKEGLNVKGLTTAASIWVNASIGAAIGMGEYIIGLSAVVITLIVLSVFAIIERVFRLKQEEGTLVIRTNGPNSSIKEITRMIESKGVKVLNMRIENAKSGPMLNLSVKIGRSGSAHRLIEDISMMDNIIDVSWQDNEDSGPLNYLESI